MNIEDEESFQKSAFHQELFGNLTFFCQHSHQKKEYEQRDYISSILSQSDPEPREKKKVLRVQTLELLSMLRQGADTYLDFKTTNDLKRIRFAYITHLIDWLVQERGHVRENDIRIRKIQDMSKVTLDNVFEIAK